MVVRPNKSSVTLVPANRVATIFIYGQLWDTEPEATRTYVLRELLRNLRR